MKRMIDIAHFLSQECEHDIACDFTCGNGHDTLFLASHFKKVIAFDIQEEAIENAKELCQNCENVEFHHQSHALANEYIQTFDFGIFNCGYLPGANHMITTNSESVICSLEGVLPLLSKKGRIIVVLYPGFAQGEKEAIEVEKYCSNLDSRYYECAKINMLNKNKSPYVIFIEKR